MPIAGLIPLIAAERRANGVRLKAYHFHFYEVKFLYDHFSLHELFQTIPSDV